jgi:hypothetical protein
MVERERVLGYHLPGLPARVSCDFCENQKTDREVLGGWVRGR